ncbi:hypothetical protein OKA05_04495 [Luteolibacter arcticus]|uniref:Transcriptional regulator n=1 Tax=Luteolibacter arcticus TaxID=1581411 RepID=A0ABT3GE01_9BACT|nr:hypothetical protein [Luteolibacter arcticus]MCW1921799.1 hypothetical protein [Luteolibacter arcticus]
MAVDPLPTEVKQFIVSHLVSVEELEILLMLAKGERQDWTVDPIYQVILSSRSSVERALEKFTAIGILQKSADAAPLYCFQPQGGDSAIRELARCYREAPVRVIEAIYQRNRDSVQGFADAFKLKPDDP